MNAFVGLAGRGALQSNLEESDERDYYFRLSDIELLKTLLCFGPEDADGSAMAQELMQEFGDINKLMAARPSKLTKYNNRCENISVKIKVLEAIGHRMAQARILKVPVLSNWDDLLVYLRVKMSHKNVEQLRVLHLDRENGLIADELQSVGTIDHVPVYPREILLRAIELNSAALIIAHNHPSGNPLPSESDIEMTYRISTACRALGVILHDHIIVGNGSVFSFRKEGLLI